MDLIAYRITKTHIHLKPGYNLSQRVWRYLAKDKGAIPGFEKELTAQGIFHGWCWMINPHEIGGLKKSYDPAADVALNHVYVSVWIYALMPRPHAIIRKLASSKHRGGNKAYPAAKFFGRQKIH